MAMNRNAHCWCGSGKKYKQCHERFDIKLQELAARRKVIPPRSLIKNQKDIMGIKKSAKINTAVLDHVAQHIKAGMSTAEIDRLVHDFTIAQGAIPAPLNYEGFPKSCCTSINNEVCHGIPSEDIILKEGDIVNVDVSTIYKGYFSDASRMFMIGEVSEDAQKIVRVAKECLEVGLKAVHPWGTVGDIGAAVYAHAKENGCSVVVDFAGHGIGKAFHEDPCVRHVGMRGAGMVLAPGMVFTIEPMINLGDYHLYIDEENGWTAYTKDGSLSAQWEHTILVTNNGIEILTW